MDSTQKGIISLIKSAVLQEPFPLPEDFSIEEAYPQIVRHHIVPMAFEGGVLCGIPRQDPVMRKLFQGYCKSLQISQGQMEEVERLFGIFEENGIDYLPLKGCVMKGYYPKPELRIMGDADILIRPEQYQRIESIMKSHGFQWKSDGDPHVTWYTDRLNIELHWKLMHEVDKLFHDYFADSWKFASAHTGHKYAMSVEDTYLFLFVHFTKHFMFSGIGCRQVVDLWLYRRKHPELNETQLRRELGKMNLLEFYENIRGLLDYWFEEGEGSEKLEYISRFIFSNGSWGFMSNQLLSQAVHYLHDSKSQRRAKIKFYVKRLFPKASLLQNRFPVLRKAPWLLPVIWVVRVFDKLFVKRDFSSKMNLFQKTLSEDSITEKYEAFRYVGLDQCL